jgi:Helicase associated domain
VPTCWSKWNTERWERGFAALSRFRAREGHCCPARRHIEGGFNLGQWVSTQRYWQDFVPVERKRRLNAMGFVWDWRDQLWEQNFAALLKFKRREGHCCVPTYYRKGDLKLGWWVATQRRNKKEMSAERRARLNKIGFEWKLGYGGRWLFARQTARRLRRRKAAGGPWPDERRPRP